MICIGYGSGKVEAPLWVNCVDEGGQQEQMTFSMQMESSVNSSKYFPSSLRASYDCNSTISPRAIVLSVGPLVIQFEQRECRNEVHNPLLCEHPDKVTVFLLHSSLPWDVQKLL